MREAGLSLREIAHRVNRNVSTVLRCWSKWSEEGVQHRRRGSGRPRRTTDREERRLRLLATRDRFSTTRSIANDWMRAQNEEEIDQDMINELDGNNRQQCVVIDQQRSSFRPIRAGVPQGSILGPLLYSIYTSTFAKYLKFTNCHFYAADTQIYYSFFPTNVERACEEMNNDIERLHTIATKHSLCLNPTKTDLILFGPKRYRMDLTLPMPFGTLPIYEENGKIVSQSVAIARYVAKKVGLTGDNNWEDLEIDAMVDTINDLRIKLSGIYEEKNEKRKQDLKTTHLTETIPFYLERLNNIAEKNGGFLVAGKCFVLDMASLIKLTYFDIKGLAEPIRLLLKYGQIEFEDIRISKEDWPEQKPSKPFGQLPIYQENDKLAWQSTAICRYVAKKVKLAGSNDWEDLEIDAVVDTYRDLNHKVGEYNRETNSERKQQLKESLLNETIPFYLKRLDNIAKENNGYLALKKLTWADIYFYALLERFAQVYPQIFVEYINLARVRKNVHIILQKCI
ncbi:glutathione s-transferase [Holotrichia oblita]|uniref:Glutathione s-transferase n=1 Tax=Holotrichia oblita TaxID=644536 RepID=A0ACB9TV15_HOLOL|nr:glutathione s-transferase [Holotrichia oblita]